MKDTYEPDVPTGAMVFVGLSETGNNVQCQTMEGQVRCANANTGRWEQMWLEKVPGKPRCVIITSQRNGKNLQCRPNGEVQFKNKNKKAWETWVVEQQDDCFVLTSKPHELRLHCRSDGTLHCSAIEDIFPAACGEFNIREAVTVTTGRDVVLTAHTGNNMQCHTFDGYALCKNKNTRLWECIQLQRSCSNAAAFIIYTERNHGHLRCGEDGQVRFSEGSNGTDPAEQWTVAQRGDHVEFASMYGTLQCAPNGMLRCSKTILHKKWSQFRVLVTQFQHKAGLRAAAQGSSGGGVVGLGRIPTREVLRISTEETARKEQHMFSHMFHGILRPCHAAEREGVPSKHASASNQVHLARVCAGIKAARELTVEGLATVLDSHICGDIPSAGSVRPA